MGLFGRKEENKQVSENLLREEDILQDQQRMFKKNDNDMRKIKKETLQCARRAFCQCGSICER